LYEQESELICNALIKRRKTSHFIIDDTCTKSVQHVDMGFDISIDEIINTDNEKIMKKMKELMKHL